MQRLGQGEIEALVGKPMASVLMKQIDTLDEGCRRVLERSPIAGFGYRDEQGTPHSTFLGGRAGFVQVDSPRRIAVEVDPGVAPKPGCGVSFVFMLPGIGDTLRVNGLLAERRSDRLVIHVEEAFVHCPKCILRSGLWSPRRPERTAPLAPGDGPLAARPIADFLASSPFAVISTWDGSGASDTSPRGDPPGFIQVLDAKTIAIPDRKGNQRIDTLHNLMACEQIALAAVVPGRHQVLHLHGTAWVTDEPALLSTMALKGKPPQLALRVRVLGAELLPSDALRAARPWRAASHVGRAELPDFIQLGAQHLARNRDTGSRAWLMRWLARSLGALPSLARWVIDTALRSDLEKEGYAEVRAGLRGRRVRVAEVRRETQDAVTLVLEDGAPFEFRAGQYFTLCVELDGESIRRAYSATSLPGEPRLALTIKRVPHGRCSNHVNERVRAGDWLELVGPSGQFAVDPDPARRRDLVLIAGGSGITPIASIAQTLLAREPGTRLMLLYGNRTSSKIIFAEALERLLAEHPDRFHLRHVLETPPPGWTGGCGLLDADTLRAELQRLAPSPDALYFVCGPEPMLHAARQALDARGIEASRVSVERFSPPRSAAPKRAVHRRLPMHVEQAGRSLGATEIDPGKTLLEAGLAAGLPMPYSCAMGNCGECRVKLTQGDVQLDEPSSLTPEERAQGYILTCVARPLSPTCVELEADESE